MVFLEISQNSQENICARASFLINETLAQVFSCEFCKISKNTFFTKHLWMTASIFWVSKKVIMEKFNTCYRCLNRFRHICTVNDYCTNPLT